MSNQPYQTQKCFMHILSKYFMYYFSMIILSTINCIYICSATFRMQIFWSAFFPPLICVQNAFDITYFIWISVRNLFSLYSFTSTGIKYSVLEGWNTFLYCSMNLGCILASMTAYFWPCLELVSGNYWAVLSLVHILKVHLSKEEKK